MANHKSMRFMARRVLRRLDPVNPALVGRLNPDQVDGDKAALERAKALARAVRDKLPFYWADVLI
jgi:hypothetical protein